MKKRILPTLLTLLVLSIAISAIGCSSQNNSQAPSVDSNESQEDASDEDDTLDKDVTVTLQTWNPGQEPMDNVIIEDFEIKNPGLKLSYSYIPYSDHIQKLKIDLSSGQGPDIFGMQTGAVLKEFRDFEMPLTSYAVATWGDDWKDKFLPFTMDLLDEDEYYGLPLGMTYAGFVWADKAMLNSYGLEVPSSLDELKTITGKLREKGELPLVIGAKDDWINIDTWMSIANDINPEKLYSAIEGETQFTDPDLIQSFEIWQSLFIDGVFQDGALGVNVYEDTTHLFEKEGSIPMIMNGSWTVGSYLNRDPQTEEVFNGEGKSHQVFLVDWNNDGKVAPVTATIDVVLCMNKDTKNPDEAWKLMDYMLHDGQDILINQFLYYLPSRTDMELDVEGMSEDGMKNLNYIVEQSKSNVAGYRENPYPELKQSICDNLKALALEEITPEQAGEAIESASKVQER